MSILFAPPARNASHRSYSARRRPAGQPRRTIPAGGGPKRKHAEEMAGAIEELAATGGQGDSIEWYGPSLASSGADAAGALARWERMAASPSTGAWPVVHVIRKSTSAASCRGSASPRSSSSAAMTGSPRRVIAALLADHLPGARYFEQPGDHLLWLGDTDADVHADPGAPGRGEPDIQRSSPDREWPMVPVANSRTTARSPIHTQGTRTTTAPASRRPRR